MNYIWEIALKMQSEGVPRGDLFYRQAKECSAYYEQAFVNMNEKHYDNPMIDINSLYRFQDIFDDLLNPRLAAESEEYKKYLLDVIVHFLVEIDLHAGLTKKEFYVRKILENIREGHYGDKNRDSLLQLSKRKQYVFCDYLLTQFKTGSSILLFSKAMKILFPGSFVYKDNMKMKTILLYVGQPDSNEVKMRIDLVSDLFFPLEYTLRLFYEHHFGILDVEETMEIDNIEIL